MVWVMVVMSRVTSGSRLWASLFQILDLTMFFCLIENLGHVLKFKIFDF